MPDYGLLEGVKDRLVTEEAAYLSDIRCLINPMPGHKINSNFLLLTL